MNCKTGFEWTFSKTGKNHHFNGTENQDVVFINADRHMTFAAVADGVSSCANSRQGAEIACEILFQALKKELDYLFSLNKKSIAFLVINLIRSEIEKRAGQAQEDAFSFASTLSFVCIDKEKNKGMFFSVGNSDIAAVTKERKIESVCRTEAFRTGKCCATLTKHAYDHAVVEFFDPANLNAVFIGSDGAWNVMCKNGAIDPAVTEYLKENDGSSLTAFFSNAENADDCSFVFLKIAA